MTSFTIANLVFPNLARAAGDGFARTFTAQLGLIGMLLLQVCVWQLRTWRPRGKWGDLATIGFLLALITQYALASYVTYSAFSAYLLPAGAIAFLLLVVPLFFAGDGFPRARLVTLGLILLAGLTVLTFAIRHSGELYFDWDRTLEELSFAAAYNRGRGIRAWVSGFFLDDILCFFWWILLLGVVGAEFLYLAFRPVARAPTRRVRPMRRRR